MNKALEKSVEHFTQRWGEVGSFWGINKVMGQLYALLFASDKPLTLDDMSVQLGISRGNVSMNIRALKEWGIIRKVRVKGDRKDYYELDEDMWKVIIHFVRERKKRELEPVLDTISRSSDLLRSSISSMNAVDRKKASVFLKRLDDMHKISEAVNVLLERFIQGEEVTSSTLRKIPIQWK
ncbi:HTH domain-containing protein [bacterium]|nr:HTH domain-containing protein [bacterium]